MRKSTINTLLLSTLFFLFVKSTVSMALEIDAVAGYDSNPYKLSTPHTESTYTLVKINHSGKQKYPDKAELQYSLGITNQFYESNSSDADTHRLNARVRWIERFKIGNKSASLLSTADIRMERRTYFSQTQRKVAETSKGDSLADRFDYDSVKLATEFTYRFDKYKSLSMFSYLYFRNYVEDYEDLGLESLDYTEFGLQPTFRYKTEDDFYARAFLFLRLRDYDDLQDDDENGKNIEGSYLDYEFTGFGLLLQKPISDKIQLKLYTNGYQARDKASGYRDLNYRKTELSLTYNVEDRQTLKLSGNCYCRDYLMNSARPPESETGDAGRKRDGCFAELSYTEPLDIWKKDKLSWQAKATTGHEKNSDDALNYYRSTFEIGLGYQF